MPSTLTRRLIALVIGVSVFSTVAVTGAAVLATQRAVLPTELTRHHANTVRLAGTLEAYTQALEDDVQWLSATLPVAAAADLNAEGHTDAARATERILRAALGAKSHYLQGRVLSDGGVERVRVERTAERGPLSTVPSSDLQDKSSRAYIRDALSHGPFRVVLSPIEPNMEHGAYQVPVVPVLRASMLMLDPGGAEVGIIVVNMDMRGALQGLRQDPDVTGALYVIDGNGEFIVHPDRDQEFAHALRDGPGFREALPDLATAVDWDNAPETTKTFVHEGLLTTWLPMELGEHRIYLLSRQPADATTAMAAATRFMLPAAGGVGLLAILLAWALGRSITQPIRAMTETVQALPDADLSTLPVDSGGEVGTLAHTFRTTWDQLQAHTAALHASQEQVAAIVDQSPTAIVLVNDEDGTIAKANSEANALLAPKGSVIEGFRLDRFLQAPSGGSSAEERTLSRDDGSQLTVAARSVPFSVNATKQSLWVLHDVHLAAALRDWFAGVLDSVPIAIIVRDAHGQIIRVNQAALALFARDGAELANCESGNILRPSPIDADGLDRAAPQPPWEAVQPDGTTTPVEVTTTTVDLGMAHSKVHITSIVDCSEREAYEQTLRRSNRELEQFAYIASHDLQEPLRMVANYTELFAERYEGQLDERGLRYLHYARDGALRMQRLIVDMLEFSRVSTRGKELTPVDATDVVEQVVWTLRPALEESGGRVAYDSLPMVLADAGQLTQVFQNLIGNALKFRNDAPPLIEISARREGPLWEFRVSDNGIGIEPRFASRIFEMFKRLHGVGTYEGSGIGLAITRRIIERHGGTIELVPSDPPGTTFLFTLPALILHENP